MPLGAPPAEIVSLARVLSVGLPAVVRVWSAAQKKTAFVMLICADGQSAVEM